MTKQDNARVEAIVKAVLKHSDPETPIFLLIDPMVEDILPELDLVSDAAAHSTLIAIREEAWQRPVFPVALHESIELPPIKHPYLVSLEGCDDIWLYRSVELALRERQESWGDGLRASGEAAHRIGGWLLADEASPKLAGVLHRWMQLRVEPAVPFHYLRLADPRVLALLRIVLGDDVLVPAMGPVRQWFYLDGYARLVLLDNPQAKDANPLHDYRLPPLKREEWQIMSRGPAIHGGMARAFGQGLDARKPPLPAYGAAIKAVQQFDLAENPSRAPVHKAIARRLRAPDDLGAAVALSLLHPGWDARADVRQWLDGAPKDYSFNTLSSALHAQLNRYAS